ncbi:MAG: ABC transporter ATP-binding protein [Bdellovibrionaceae bacterium]|nr:ABC transporter ATP-binding protein [Pseudobdellovibrionaceae bacterium]
MIMIKVDNVKKSFGEPPIEILHGITFEIPDKSFVSITGKSGSGKSTLLYSMSTLDHPTSGSVYFDGVEISSMNEKEVHEFRNLKMGFIFQFHYLLPELSALENVLMPARRTGQHIARRKRAVDLLTEFGIEEKLDRLPRQLSGGEQQRVAIARSLIQEPKYIFADEPTGNLDSANGEIVMNWLKKATRDSNTTVIYVTHDPDFAALADQKILLKDGRLEI